MSSLHQQFINFADKELLTTIRTSSLTVDGSEVENLISKRRSFHHQNAFLCEHYMKCPVEIFLTFPCLIDISTIIIEHKVSSHRSKEIELFAKNQVPIVPNRMKVSKDPNLHEVDAELYPCRYPDDFNDDEVCKNKSVSFRFTGKYKEPPGAVETPDRLIFTNYSGKKLFEPRPNDLTLNLHSMSCTSNLMIKIRIASVPALRSLKVWGRLSNRNPKHVSIELEKLLRKLNKSKIIQNTSVNDKTKNIKPPPTKSVKESTSNGLKKNANSKLGSDIPEEFIDPLTYALMTVPMMLPSGNTIDKTTLEKYAAEEEKHGRLPSDPFTGIVFHGSRVAIPNTTLKARIDAFLLKNTHLYKNGATTGYRNNEFTRTVDNVIEALPSTSKAEKRKLEVPKEDIKRTCSTPPSLPGNKHEDNMKSSLDLALGKVLSNLPKYGSSKHKKEKPICMKCNDEEFRNLFRLPCTHICCRNCMQDLLKTTTKCAKCGKVFGRYSVTKLTVTS